MSILINPEEFDLGAVVNTYGSLDRFACDLSQAYKQNPTIKQLKAIRYMLQSMSLKKGIRLNQQRIDILNQDIELMTYFKSVDKNGEDCWKDEISRVRKQMLIRCPKEPISLQNLRKQTFDGAQNISLEAINDLIPTWQSWGRLLLLHGA